MPAQSRSSNLVESAPGGMSVSVTTAREANGQSNEHSLDQSCPMDTTGFGLRGQIPVQDLFVTSSP